MCTLFRKVLNFASENGAFWLKLTFRTIAVGLAN